MGAIRARCFALSVLSAISVIMLPVAHGAGIFIDACGGVEAFTGGGSAVVHCSIGTTADNAIGGSTGIALSNFFENHLSPIHFYGDTDAFAGMGTWKVTTFPTWDVATVGTYLELDGSVKLQGPGSKLVITLTGTLGGPAQVITRTFNWTGAPTEDILKIPSLITQATAGAAVETLTISITGRARYDVDGSPIFTGTAPEPSTWATLAAGLAVLLGLRKKGVVKS